MVHRLVTVSKKHPALPPGETLVLSFRPGIAANMSVSADLSEQALTKLVLRDAAGNELRTNSSSWSPLVSHQPAAVADFRAELTNRSAAPVGVVLTAEYYSAAQVAEQAVPLAKVMKRFRKIVDDDLKPHLTMQGKRLKIGGDPSVVALAGKHADADVDVGYLFDDVEIVGSGLQLGFDPPTADHPFGSAVITITCRRPVTVAKTLWKLKGKIRFDKPTFSLRVGLNVYGDSLHLGRPIIKLPPFDPNWVATLGNAVLGVLSDLEGMLTNMVAAAIRKLDESGALATYTAMLARILGYERLLGIQVSSEALVLAHDPAPSTQPALTAVKGPGPRSSRLEHLVIVMLENRSFDHMMADVVAGRNDVRRAPDDYHETVAFKSGPKTFKRSKTALHRLPQDPPHDSVAQDVQARGEFVHSFFLRPEHANSPHGGEVLNYQPRENVPFFDFLAREFVICDDWRAALRGHTWPNRQYSLAGASEKNLKGYRDNPDAKKDLVLYTRPTICDVLEAQQIDWAYYIDDFGFLELYRRWIFDETRVRSHADFENSIAKGKLPAVSWFEPNISDFGRSAGSDDHPPISVFPGQRLLAKLYAQLCRLPTPNWMLAITYDESGGFYDHLPADEAPDDQPLATKRGFRVPAFLVSPWLQPGKVVTTRFDHTSLIRTVLEGFCAPEPIFKNNKRVNAADHFAAILDPASPYAASAARAMPRFTTVIPDGSLGLQLAGATDGGGEDGVPRPQTPEFTAFEAAREALRAELAVRRRRDPTLELAGARDLAGPPPQVSFEGLYVRSRELPPQLAALGWTARPWFDDALEARPPVPLAVDVAWDLVHDLRARNEGVTIEPLWETWLPALEDERDVGLGLAGQPPDHRWHLKAMKAERAWELVPGRGGSVVIGHLDTGYLGHPDLDPMMLTGYGWDVYRDDPDARDELEHGFLKFPGHGAATASVIGGRGVASDVLGTAPAVSAIPIRISPSVVHLSTTNLVRGIQLAVERNVEVIALAAGGLWSTALHRAVRDAVEAGVIVVAAAGNYTGEVVWPARYDEVIACGATDASGAVWRWSNAGRGAHVTVMAPGVEVWALRPDQGGLAPGPSTGTSFATACVAGAIALWLEHHRSALAELIERDGKSALARAAKAVLRSLGDANGAGDVDLERLLAAPLPADLPPLPPAPAGPVEFAADLLQIAGTPRAAAADELAFRDYVEQLSRRAAAPGAPAGPPVVPLDTLGGAVPRGDIPTPAPAAKPIPRSLHLERLERED